MNSELICRTVSFRNAQQGYGLLLKALLSNVLERPVAVLEDIRMAQRVARVGGLISSGEPGPDRRRSEPDAREVLSYSTPQSYSSIAPAGWSGSLRPTSRSPALPRPVRHRRT